MAFQPIENQQDYVNAAEEEYRSKHHHCKTPPANCPYVYCMNHCAMKHTCPAINEIANMPCMEHFKHKHHDGMHRSPDGSPLHYGGHGSPSYYSGHGSPSYYGGYHSPYHYGGYHSPMYYGGYPSPSFYGPHYPYGHPFYPMHQGYPYPSPYGYPYPRVTGYQSTDEPFISEDEIDQVQG